MVKTVLITSIVVLINLMCVAQSTEELQRINGKSKTLFVRPEILDQLLIELRKYETSPQRDQDTLLLDTYRSISSAYMANNHFKKAYEIFSKYIFRKEEMLSADKKNAIDRINNSVLSKQQVDDRKESELQNNLAQLKEVNKNLETRRISFKTNFSLALIILTAIFAIMLVSSGIRIMSLNTILNQNRERMKIIHRKAVVGNYSEGLKSALQANLTRIEEQTKVLQQSLKKQEQSFSPVKQANQLLSAMEKNFKEIIN